MTYPCELTERPAQPVLSIRTRAAVQDLPQALGQAYGAIAQYLAQLGQQPAGAPFTAYYNMDMQDLDIEVGFPVASSLPGNAQIQASEIPAGQVVSLLYVGPYDQCAPAYEAAEHWMNTNGHESTGVVYEFYLNDPSETPPDALQTQIVFPLKAT